MKHLCLSLPRVICVCACLALTGCSRHFFSVRGEIGTNGPAFGQWASAPQGCSRDPIDGLPDGSTDTLATFFWQDPAVSNPMLRDHRMAHVPDAPDRVNLLRSPTGGYAVRVKTVETGGWLIHPEDCTRLDVETHEQKPAFAGGRPSLAGTIHFDCRVKQSRVFADLAFSRCDY